MNLFNSININDIKGKIFEGYILDKKDPLNLNRYAVYIPELMAPARYGSKWVWCKNVIGSFTRHRDPMTQIYYSYGSYQPLMPGTRVLVAFIKNNLEDGGYIISVTSTIKNENNDRDNYTLVYKTKNGSKFYIDENKDILHISHSQGHTNIYLSKEDIILQINEKDKDKFELSTAIKMHKNEINFIFEDTVYKFDKNGFSMSLGEENNLSFLNITKDGIHISGQKYINIVSNGKLNLNGNKTFLTGYDECHVFSNDLRLTGSQKAQLSGTTVNVQGWFDTHVKAMHVGIEAFVSLDTQSLFTNNFQLVANNSYAPIYNITSMIYTNSTQIHARASTIESQDGFILSGMGIGASTASTVGTSLSTSLLSLKITLMTMNTGLLLNDPTGSVAAINYILTGSIAGSASPASDLTPVTLPSPASDIKDPIAGLATKIEKDEDRSKFNTTPDEVFTINI
jgi:hypothetical protein